MADDLCEKMKKLIADRLEIEESKITLDSSFRQDLGAEPEANASGLFRGLGRGPAGGVASAGLGRSPVVCGLDYVHARCGQCDVVAVGRRAHREQHPPVLDVPAEPPLGGRYVVADVAGPLGLPSDVDHYGTVLVIGGGVGTAILIEPI